MFSKITILGRICADPELRQTTNGISVTNINVAVERRFSKDRKSDFYNVTAYRQQAEFICRYFKKGHLIMVHGDPSINEYTDRKGIAHSNIVIEAQEVSFCDSGDKKTKEPAVAEEPVAAFVRPSHDDGLPF